MAARALEIKPGSPYDRLVGVGGIGTGIFFALEGDDTLGRNESRPARLLDVRDYCKLHIVAHYVAKLCGARPEGAPFHVVPVGKVGADPAGERLREEMAAAGMDLSHVESVPGRPTLASVCFQYPDGSGGNITTSGSAAAALAPGDVDRAGELVGEKCIVLAAPEAPLAARRRLLEIGTERGALRAAAFTSAETAEVRAGGVLSMVDLLAVNEDEAAAILGRGFDGSGAFLADFAAELPGARVLLSAGARGAWGCEGGAWQRCPAARVEVACTAGGGDALFGGALAALAAGAPFVTAGGARERLADRSLSSALDLAVLLAGLAVTSPHTIHPGADLDSLLAFAKEQGVSFSEELSALCNG